MWGQSYIPNGRGRGNITGRGGSGRRNNTNMHVTMNMSSGRGGAGGGGMNNNNNANSMNMNLNNTLNSNMSMNNMTMPAFQSISSSSNQNERFSDLILVVCASAGKLIFFTAAHRTRSLSSITRRRRSVAPRLLWRAFHCSARQRDFRQQVGKEPKVARAAAVVVKRSLEEVNCCHH